jgi:hypothetical protein
MDDTILERFVLRMPVIVPEKTAFKVNGQTPAITHESLSVRVNRLQCFMLQFRKTWKNPTRHLPKTS